MIINTDYKSFLTNKYFSKKITKKYNSSAFTTVIDHERINNDVAIQVFTQNGPLAFLPISKVKTSIVYSYDTLNKKSPNISELIYKYNFRYRIKKIQKIKNFELKSFTLRSYYNNNILAFGDLLHTIHPLAGQGFNMTIRDIKTLINIIISKKNLGLTLNSSVNSEFEKKLRHKNYIFSNGVDLIHEFFNLERKIKSSLISKTIQILSGNPNLNKFFIKIADSGLGN